MPESNATTPSDTIPDSLGASLGPVIQRATNGRLDPIDWFKATWQRGGASTGYSKWSGPDGKVFDVMVKVPVGPVERDWTHALGHVEEHGFEHDQYKDSPTPRVLAAGDTLGGYDLAWIVMERFPGHPLPVNLTKTEVLQLLQTAAQFQRLALERRPQIAPVRVRDWPQMLEHSREAAKTAEIPHHQRWNEAIKRTQKAVGRLSAQWLARPVSAWCHGDLHPGNAMLRKTDDGQSRCVLIDLALVHPGHWIEDALYLERQYWGHDELLHNVKPVAQLAKYRRELGLELGDGYADLADTRRILMAANVPAYLNQEGNPKYVEAALSMLERLLDRRH